MSFFVAKDVLRITLSSFTKCAHITKDTFYAGGTRRIDWLVTLERITQCACPGQVCQVPLFFVGVIGVWSCW